VACARVEGERRRGQAYLVEQQRLFVFDLWAQESILVAATTKSVMEVARRIHMWLASMCLAGDVVAGLERVSVRDDGMVYDAREEVDQAWREMSHVRNPNLTTFVREASARERLRQLFPYGGDHYFGFSRCTRYPFTQDIPVVWPIGRGQFKVLDKTFKNVLGCGDAAYAANVVVALLPPNCGPAVAGTCEALRRLEQ